MSNDLPLTGSYWQDKSTKKIYRVTSILDRDQSSQGTDAIDFQDVETGDCRVRFCSVASDWHNSFTPINEPPPPSIGSHWQHTDTRKLYRVINIFKGARSLHGAELIGYQDTESGECYVRFTREWDDYFTLIVFGKE